MIDMDKLDPDWTFATNHGLANKAGKPLAASGKLTSTIICRCCYEPIYKEAFPLNEHSK